MTKDPFIREKFTREQTAARKFEGIFRTLPEGPLSNRSRKLARTSIVNIEFTMKRLREPLEDSGLRR